MRYNFNDLITQITARLPDNATGAITAQVLRSLLTDFVESVRGAASYLSRSGAALSCSLTTSYQTIAALMPTVQNTAANEVEAVVGTQLVTIKLTGNYELAFDATLEGPNNTELQAAILIDTVEYPFCISRLVLTGAGKPDSMYNAAVAHLTAGQTVSLGVKVSTGTATVLIGPVALGVSFIPSRTS